MPFEKGNVWTKLKKGMKYQPTLDRERRREVFDREITQVWKDLIKQLPPQYIADQFIGKAKETLEHKHEFLFEDENPMDNVVGKVEQLPTKTKGSGTSS